MTISSDNLPDVQKTQTGFYKKKIDKVGVRNIPVVIPINMKNGGQQNILFKVSSYCSLDPNIKGINMSRTSRTINDNINNINIMNNNISEEEHMRQTITDVINVLPHDSNSISSFKNLAIKLKEAHKAANIYVKAKGVYMLQYKTPITNITSQQSVYIEIECVMIENRIRSYLTVESSEMSLCPCSREMSRLFNNITTDEAIEISKLSPSLQQKLSLSGFGAHNQRSHIKIKVELNESENSTKGLMWIEDLKNIIERASSQPTYTVLKRPDEKYLTETSYCGGYFDDEHNFNPVENTGAKFVEDIARDCAKQLDEELDRKILDYCIVVDNEESIHSGDIMATAVLTARRDLN